MKINKFFIAAMSAVALFASCAKDGNPTQAGEEGKDTYLGISIRIPARGRADAPEVAKDWENTITKVGVYVVGPTTFHYGEFTVTADGAGYKADGSLKTTTGSKDIYVIANPTSAMSTKIAAMRASAFLAQGFGYDETGFITDGTSMVMTDSKLAEVIGIKTSAQAQAAPLAFELKRRVAQVVVNTKVGFAAADVVDGTITNLQFALDKKAKDSYLAIRTTTLFDVLPTSAKTDDADPYYSNFSGITTYKNVSARTGNNADLASSSVASFYCNENKHTLLADKRIGNTTVAHIKGQFTPTTVVNSYTATATPKQGTLATGTGVANADFYVLKSDNTYWDATAYAAALADGYVATDFSGKYASGVGYYKIYVKDDTNSVGVMPNYFYEMTISKITGPGTPAVDGDPTDPDYPEVPTDPIEEDTYISFTVTVQPWNLQSTDNELQ